MLLLEVGEMVTCEPEWEPALARMSMTGTDDGAGGGDGAGVTAVGELQPMLTVQPNLYFGVRTLVIVLSGKIRQ